jgi:O-antigen ligase
MTLIRVGVCLLIAYAVAAFGAVDTISVAVIEITAAALFLWWALGVAFGKTGEIHWAPVLWPLLGIEVIGLVQLVARFSLYPYLTRIELALFTSYLMILFLALQAFRTVRQWRAFAWFLIWLGFFVAIFGIMQHLTFNDKIYWLRAVPHGSFPFGPFVNRNHFAGCMELIIPMGLGILAARGARRQQMPLVILLTVVPIAALALSASRAGIAAFGVELFVLVAVLLVSGGARRQLAIGVIVVGLALGLVAWLGFEPIMTRFNMTNAQEVSVARRISLDRGAWHIFLDHPALGTGIGTTISVYPKYERMFDGNLIDHVHDDHLEMLAETGVPGAICWLAFLASLGWFGFKRFSENPDPLLKAVHLGALVGCVGLLFHGFFDFNLHIPSNALLFYVLAGFACATPEIPVERPRK